MEIETKRLKLRQWKEKDKSTLFAMNSDSEVMKYFPSVYDKKQSDCMFEKAQTLISKNGWGFWACEIKSSREFIGFIGLNSPDIELPFIPCVEIGWRLSKKHWKKGYATEAAIASLNYGFNKLQLNEIVSFAVKSNKPSISVMERIGMSNTHSNFNHPKVDNVELKEHVLYKINKDEFIQIT